MGRPQPNADLLVARLAERQHGVVHLRDLRAAGLGDGAIRSRVRAGRLHPIHRGVFAVGHRLLSREGRWMAAVLALGGRAALSHVSAAALWEIRSSSATCIHVTVPTSAGRPSRSGIVVHRSASLAENDVTTHNGIAVTSVARTLLDLAGVLTPTRLERAVERSLALRLFDLRAIETVLATHATCRGATTLRRIVGEIHHEPSLTRLELEALMLDLWASHAIERPEVNLPIGDYVVDFLWRDARLIVETDGHRDHGTRTAFEDDRVRDGHLMMLGYRVVRVTYRRLTAEPAQVAAMIHALLGAAAPSAQSRLPQRFSP